MAPGKKITRIVADASVIVKWFVEEDDSRMALQIQESYIHEKIDIACPQLLRYEVLNALRYNPEFGEEQVRKASLALEKYQLWQHPIEEELATLCISNAFAHGISLYDSSYVSLAEYLNIPLYTADQKLLDKLGTGNEQFRHISQFAG